MLDGRATAAFSVVDSLHGLLRAGYAPSRSARAKRPSVAAASVDQRAGRRDGGHEAAVGPACRTRSHCPTARPCCCSSRLLSTTRLRRPCWTTTPSEPQWAKLHSTMCRPDNELACIRDQDMRMDVAQIPELLRRAAAGGGRE